MAPICDDSLCFSTLTAGYVVACTWTGSGHTWQLTGPTVLLKLCWHPEFWSSFINKHSLLMQTEAVVHCQIQQQTITCCNAELSLSNHRYIAAWTLDGKNIWQNLRCSFGVHYLHLKNVGSLLLIIQHENTPLFLLMFDIKHKKPPFLNKHSPNSTKKTARWCKYHTAARHRTSTWKVLHQTIFKSWQVCKWQAFNAFFCKFDANFFYSWM